MISKSSTFSLIVSEEPQSGDHMKYVSTAAIGLGVTLATPVNATSYEDTWVLLGLDIHMGAVTTRHLPRSTYTRSWGGSPHVSD